MDTLGKVTPPLLEVIMTRVNQKGRIKGENAKKQTLQKKQLDQIKVQIDFWVLLHK